MSSTGRTVPWDFSEEPLPGQDKPNTPTDAGRALGAQIARLAGIEETKQLRQFPNMKRRCSDCAARVGTLPNGCEETLMDFLKCVVEGRQFNCHLGVKDGEKPTRVCAGWTVLYTAGQFK